VSEIKSFQIRLPKELWIFLKQRSVAEQRAMNQIIIDSVTNLKKTCEKRLTEIDSVVL